MGKSITFLLLAAITTVAVLGCGAFEPSNAHEGDSRIRELQQTRQGFDSRIRGLQQTRQGLERTRQELEPTRQALRIRIRPTAEFVPIPTFGSIQPARGESRQLFAACLNDVSEELTLLPWEHQVKDPEGASWQLRDYGSGSRGEAVLSVFKYLHCQSFAPVTADREQVNRCIVDNVKYIRESYPGGAVQKDALTFALAVCIPPYEDN